MALIKKQLLAKEDMLLSADNTPVSQARAGTTVSVHPVNASVIPYDENRSIAEAIQGVTYTHPLTHPVSIIDGSSNPSKFVKTDALGNTGFDGVAWADIEGKPGTYTPSAHEHNMAEVTAGTLSATRVDITADRQFITAEQAAQLLEMEVKSNKGIPNGYAPLDSNGKINSSFLSDLNLVEVFTPEDLASMLALTSAQPGDIAYRQDNSTSYMLVALPSSTEANWKSLNTGSQIISVNGQTGIVSLNTSDIAEATNLYFTNERVDDRVATLLQAGTNITLAYNDTLNTLTINANDTIVNWSEIQSKPTTVSGYGITDAYTKTESDAVSSLKANLASPTLTGTPTAPTASIGTNTTQLATTAFVKAEIANDTYSKAVVDAEVVHKTGDETIAGIKTFSSSPIVPNATTATQAIAYGQAVKNTGDETIAGVKTFTTNPNIYTPSVPIFNTAGQFQIRSSDAVGADKGGSLGFTANAMLGSTPFNNYPMGSISARLMNTTDLSSYMAFTTTSNGGTVSERLRIDTSGNVLVTGSGGLGYGTGSGGTVTQLTSKSTAVTLNKPCGQITMNNAALAAGATVGFIFNNSAIDAYGTFKVCITNGNGVNVLNYEAEEHILATGLGYIKVKNLTASSLSEAIVLNFTITKGAIV